MSKPERVVLVDGSWLIFRAFFAIPPNLTTGAGLHTNAVFGFATMFRKLFAARRPERGAVVFDAAGPTHREARYPSYKAQRPALPAELAEQLPHIDRVVTAHRFPVLRAPGYEADDIIGTLARQAAEAGMEVLIVSGDKDFAQLVGDRVRMLDTLRDVTYDAELVQKKWGVPPSQIVDLLALMGDSSDNIPGVPGVGQKGAAGLLARHGSLDGVLAHAAELPARQRAALEEHRAQVRLWQELATIDRHVPLAAGLEDLRLVPPDPAALDALYKELEFFSLLAQRELAKLINTYTDVLREAILPETGRIHATFQQTVGVSGRLISTDPDLQRTPVRTPEGKRIRRAFIAPEGRRLISADWSQIELRVLAHFSRDERLLEAFRDGLDVHRRTASQLFGVLPEDVTAAQRGAGKTVNFATIYGQGATALGQILGIPRKEAQQYIDSYFVHYAGVRAWLDRTIADALACGYVTTLLGRRRYIPELSSRSEMDRKAGERIAANTPIQGSAADLCKLAMLQIAGRLGAVAPGTRMLLQVHDELVFEAPEAEVEPACALVREVMTRPYPLEVPLLVGVGVGKSWGEAH